MNRINLSDGELAALAACIQRNYDYDDLSGKLVKKQIRSLSELPAGTYILKDGSVTTKVVRR
jgi:hypothetical protein